MSDTKAAKPVRVVSLFCGCGNGDAGLYDAAAELGIEVEVAAAYDSWPRAVEVYNANLPHPVAQVCDLKTLQRSDLPLHDLVIGGPPCQPFSMAGKRDGHADERNCLPDFIRLAGDSPYLMENVVPRLINAPFSVKLCAADFGDVTSRKRWFYSNYLLHVIPTPGPRRIRDIRDHAEDERVLKKRGMIPSAIVTHRPRTGTDTENPYDTHIGDGCVFGSLTADAPRASRQETLVCKAGAHEHYDSLDSLQSHSWHGHDVRGSGKLVAIAAQSGRRAVLLADDDDVMPSAFANQSHGLTENMKLRLGLRGNSASAFEDGEVLGSVLSNSFHANEASRIVACRNPSLLEMQRAHSFPDSWDWCGATKTDRGKMIANSWPREMATAACKAMLIAIGARERQTA